ncbi:hypothetical protein ABZY10_05885 [Streptomyces sp. NPDC006539]|uniref:hypothetical protein n=1 Tax=Streptomyces sp. NPDC006539 TaxID=3155352 RepID=UPI0033B69E7F
MADSSGLWKKWSCGWRSCCSVDRDVAPVSVDVDNETVQIEARSTVSPCSVLVPMVKGPPGNSTSWRSRGVVGGVRGAAV